MSWSPPTGTGRKTMKANAGLIVAGFFVAAFVATSCSGSGDDTSWSPGNDGTGGGDTTCAGVSVGSKNCNECVNRSCCTLSEACSADTACDALVKCRGECQKNDADCLANCEQANASGLAAWENLESCLSASCGSCITGEDGTGGTGGGSGGSSGSGCCFGCGGRFRRRGGRT